MRKRALFEHIKDPKVHQSIDSLILKLSSEYRSDDLEADIIALFEHIVMFFSAREEDFINLNSMSSKEKEELYTEIRLIIEILKKLKHSTDRHETIKILSKNLIKNFSKSRLKHGYIIDQHEIFTMEEQEKIKQEFIRITIQILNNQRLESYRSASKLKKRSISAHNMKPQSRGVDRSF